VFYPRILLSVSPIIIVIMCYLLLSLSYVPVPVIICYLVPTPESFEIMNPWFLLS
jgi:hypothetical protein